MSDSSSPNPFALNPQPPGSPSSQVAGPSNAPTISNPIAIEFVDPSPQSGNSPQMIREHFIRHESSLRAMGSFFMLLGMLSALLCVLFVGLFFSAVNSIAQEQQAWSPLLFIAGSVSAISCVLFFVCAIGLRKLRPWAQGVATVVSALALVLVPIGTIIGAYFLYHLQSRSGKVVFSSDYRDVIEKTPHIKKQMTMIDWLIAYIVIIVGTIVVTYACLILLL